MQRLSRAVARPLLATTGRGALLSLLQAPVISVPCATLATSTKSRRATRSRSRSASRKPARRASSSSSSSSRRVSARRSSSSARSSTRRSGVKKGRRVQKETKLAQHRREVRERKTARRQAKREREKMIAQDKRQRALARARDRRERAKLEEKDKKLRLKERQIIKKLRAQEDEDWDKLMTRARNWKDPNKPKRARSAFAFYVQEMTKNGGKDVTKRMKEAAANWKTFSAEQKRPYEERAKADLVRHERESKAYDAAAPPKRPISSYLRFVAEQRPKLLQEQPTLKADITAVSKELSKRWTALSDSQRAAYTAAYNQDLAAYRTKATEYARKQVAALPKGLQDMFGDAKSVTPDQVGVPLNLYPAVLAQLTKVNNQRS